MFQVGEGPLVSSMRVFCIYICILGNLIFNSSSKQANFVFQSLYFHFYSRNKAQFWQFQSLRSGWGQNKNSVFITPAPPPVQHCAVLYCTVLYCTVQASPCWWTARARPSRSRCPPPSPSPTARGACWTAPPPGTPPPPSPGCWGAGAAPSPPRPAWPPPWLTARCSCSPSPRRPGAATCTTWRCGAAPPTHTAPRSPPWCTSGEVRTHHYTTTQHSK